MKTNLIIGETVIMVVGEGVNNEHHEVKIIDTNENSTRIQVVTHGFNIPEFSIPTKLIIRRINLAIKNKTTLVKISDNC